MAATTFLLLGLMTLATAKPILVTFGTHQGPIEPPTERTIKPVPRHLQRDPAPVSELTEDIPNPYVYRAMVPHQYRNKLYQQRVPADLILGTPVDRKYTPSIQKADLFRKQARIGVDYTGPHFFEKQEYEIIEERKPTPARYAKPQYFQQDKSQEQKSVPQIGIVYSSGVRYYVPQLVYDVHRQDEEQENSVYDQQEEKYLYRAKDQ